MPARKTAEQKLKKRPVDSPPKRAGGDAGKKAPRLSAAERREAILTTAAVLFGQKGLHGVTTREIAAACGVSEPVLYRHFKSKEDLYSQLESLCHSQTVRLKSILNKLPPNAESMALLMYSALSLIAFARMPRDAESYDDANTLMRLMGYSFVGDGQFASVMLRDCIGSLFPLWRECYKAARKAGDLETESRDDMDLWFSYQAMIACGLFALPEKKLLEGFDDREKVLTRLTSFLLRGLGMKDASIARALRPARWHRQGFLTLNS